MSSRPASADLVVVGAGIIGLACASALARRHPAWRIVIVERERDVAQHQSGHNTGVIHAGIYYRPGSLKARLCVQGAQMLYRFCDEHGVAVRRVGKLIVASNVEELPRLRELERRGQHNGVPGLRWLTSAQLSEIEPHVTGIAALHSPHTGIADFPGVCRVLAQRLRAAGHELRTGWEVRNVLERGDRLTLESDHDRLSGRRALFCAGAWSDRLAMRAGAPAEPRIIPFRGAYLLLHEDKRPLVNGLIYPVPDPRLPFLGAHLTRHIDGSVSIGPTALIVGARDGYRFVDDPSGGCLRNALVAGDAQACLALPSQRLAELMHVVSRRSLVQAARRYVPEISLGDVSTGPAGVRAQALAADGSLVDDFVFSQTPRALHVRNAPSPAATSALAIGEYVADSFDERFGA